MEKLIFKLEEDIFSKEFIIKQFSRKFYGYLKSSKATFLVNNNKVEISHHLKINDIYEIHYINKEKSTIPCNKEINILYEDKYFIILDKEPNLLTIPSKNNHLDSLYNRVVFHRPNDSLNIVTRLDKLTSGCVLITKKSFLVNQLTNIKKEYLAQTSNPLPLEEGLIDLPIKKGEDIKRIISEDGKSSQTKYKHLKNNIYKIDLLTGRTHQIRVHFSYYNSPIIGDLLYGGTPYDNLKLICKKISFNHPITNEEISVISNYEME